MIIYGNKINLDLKEYLAKGHSISELTDPLENVGFDVILTPLKSYVGVIYGNRYSLEDDFYAEVERQFADLCKESPYNLAGTTGMWTVEEEDIIC